MKRGSWLWRLCCRVGLACPHHWRPAVYNGLSARYCGLCERLDHLTDGEFYAFFGVTCTELQHNLRNPKLRARPTE